MSFILLGILNAQAAGGGGGAAYDLLETQVLTSTVSGVTFTGLGTLASGYQHLQIRATGRANVPALTNARDLTLTINGDTGSNYSSHSVVGTGSSVLPYSRVSATSIPMREAWADSGNAAGIFGAAVIDVLDFNSTSKNTTVRASYGVLAEGQQRVALSSGAYYNTTAVTSLEILVNAVAGSRFSIYGVR